MRKLILLLITVVFISCTTDSESEFNHEQLTEINLTVEFDLSQSDDISFGFIRNIYLDSFENIYVTDGQRNSILIIDQNGELIREFNNRGRGPGEYLTLAQIYVNEQSLFIVDSNQLKVSEFHIENELGELTHLEDYIYPDRAFRRVVNFWAWDDENYLFVFGESFSEYDLWDQKHERLELFNKTTQEYTEIYKSPQLEYFRYSNDRGFGVRPLPYGTKPLFTYSKNELFYGHNSDFEIFKLSFQETTELEPVLSKKIEPEPITTAERRLVIEDEYYSDRNATREIREQIPEVLPFYDSFVIDDERNFWFSVNHSEYREGELYWIFDENGNALYGATLEEPVKLKAIKKNSAYGIKESEMGVQSLIKYSISK